MLRPHHFSGNEETLSTNYFQEAPGDKNTNKKALEEFDQMLKALTEKRVKVYLLNDTKKVILPDAVFLNNWFSVQPDGSLFIYPMMVESRKKEVRNDTIAVIKNIEHIKTTVDWREEFYDSVCEGTGSIVFDHHRKALFACISERTHPALVEAIAKRINYQAFIFEATDAQGRPIYHTNVMMSMGHDTVVVGLNSIENMLERKMLESYFKKHKLNIVDIGHRQISNFCGNIFEVDRSENSPVWIMSERAHHHFSDEQIRILSKDHELIVIPIPTIEKYGGGSTRCMLAASYY